MLSQERDSRLYCYEESFNEWKCSKERFSKRSCNERL